MRTKSCKHCGRAFVPATKNTYLCPECHGSAKASGVVRERICRECGAAFQGGPRAWYCPSCRADRRRIHDQASKRNGPTRQIGSTDLCTKCGGEYTVTGSRQKYCPACASDAVRETVRTHKRQYVAERAVQMAAYKKEMSSNRHVCIVCGAVFNSNLPRVTCSDVCDKIRIQRQQQAADKKRSPRKRSYNDR